MFKEYVNIDEVFVVAVIDCDDYETIQKRYIEESLKFQTMLDEQMNNPLNEDVVALKAQEQMVNNYRTAMHIVAKQLGY